MDRKNHNKVQKFAKILNFRVNGGNLPEANYNELTKDGEQNKKWLTVS